MYEQFYGLKEKPFSLTPDPEFLYLNNHFHGAFDNILYGIKRQEGFTTIVGDVGTGKTTLCWALLGKLDQNIRTALILNPLLTAEDMLKAIIQDFGISRRRNAPPPEQSDSKLPYNPSWMQGLTRKELIDELNYFLLDGAEQHIFNIIIIDESQNLSLEVLEQLRILSNLETSKEKLLQIIFVGQLEFEEKLNLLQLRQLNQRITTRYALKPFSRQDTLRYIEHRLSVAGSKQDIGFTDGALRGIYSFSKGYPRLINIICDRSLLAGFSERSCVITRKHVRKAERGLRGKTSIPKTGLAGPRKIIFPVLALIVLTVMAAILLWVLRGSLSRLGLSSVQSVPGSTQASTKSMPPPTPAIIATQVSTQQMPDPSPAVVNSKAAPPLILSAEAPDPESGNAAAASPAAPSSAVATVAGFGDYLLQVHSLDSLERAEAAIRELQKGGYSAFVKIEEGLRGRQWFVVYAGPYDDLDRARTDAATLGQGGKLRPILRRRSAAAINPI